MMRKKNYRGKGPSNHCHPRSLPPTERSYGSQVGAPQAASDPPLRDSRSIVKNGSGRDKMKTTALQKKLSCTSLKNLSKDVDLMEDALLDCYGRFISLLPDYLLEDHVHLYFQIQEAYWWYDDIWQDAWPDILPKLTLREFGYLICMDCPLLRMYVSADDHDVFMANWRNYCKTIPLRGAIILNSDIKCCLMVRGWRGGYWMFPRGKVDEKEEDAACAAREIYEEVGVRIKPTIQNYMFIQIVIEDQPIKLFIIPGVIDTHHFQPQKRKEIGKIQWMELEKLPGWLNDENESSLKTWQVYPFVKCLRGWVDLLKQGTRQKVEAPSCADAGTNLTDDSRVLAYRYSIPDVPLGVIERHQNGNWKVPPPLTGTVSPLLTCNASSLISTAPSSLTCNSSSAADNTASPPLTRTSSPVLSSSASRLVTRATLPPTTSISAITLTVAASSCKSIASPPLKNVTPPSSMISTPPPSVTGSAASPVANCAHSSFTNIEASLLASTTSTSLSGTNSPSFTSNISSPLTSATPALFASAAPGPLSSAASFLPITSTSSPMNRGSHASSCSIMIGGDDKEGSDNMGFVNNNKKNYGNIMNNKVEKIECDSNADNIECDYNYEKSQKVVNNNAIATGGKSTGCGNNISKKCHGNTSSSSATATTTTNSSEVINKLMESLSALISLPLLSATHSTSSYSSSLSSSCSPQLASPPPSVSPPSLSRSASSSSASSSSSSASSFSPSSSSASSISFFSRSSSSSFSSLSSSVSSSLSSTLSSLLSMSSHPSPSSPSLSLLFPPSLPSSSVSPTTSLLTSVLHRQSFCTR